MKLFLQDTIKGHELRARFYQSNDDNGLAVTMTKGLNKMFPELEKYDHLSYVLIEDRTKGKCVNMYADKIIDNDEEAIEFTKKKMKEAVEMIEENEKSSKI